MIISHSLQIIFVHTQRTGGSALVAALRKKYGHQIEFLSQHGNVTTPDGNLLIQYSDYFRFTMVRNPWSRLLSWYMLVNQIKTSEKEVVIPGLEYFLMDQLQEDPEFHYNQLDYVTDASGLLLVDHFYRFENFRIEVTAIFNRLGKGDFELEALNGTQPMKYQDYYTDASKKWVTEKCLKDIEYFGYRF